MVKYLMRNAFQQRISRQNINGSRARHYQKSVALVYSIRHRSVSLGMSGAASSIIGEAPRL